MAWQLGPTEEDTKPQGRWARTVLKMASFPLAEDAPPRPLHSPERGAGPSSSLVCVQINKCSHLLANGMNVPWLQCLWGVEKVRPQLGGYHSLFPHSTTTCSGLGQGLFLSVQH
ncbi:zinc finger protein RFP-like [Platysternon megacephalum]|uniref:Zinc finger protein RFP-like n=1 Tax=Platysternon megacephalum TaxID=55544 RepID=A0A4D9DWR8_9SAUR|nr:zinc finger protein RFP-like [Platysternon megacephalum]